MAILKIARMGHPILKQEAEPVAVPLSPETARIAADMIETMIDARGVGLAAPQVHISKRIIVFQVPKSRAGDPNAAPGDGDGPVPLTVLINPSVEPLDDTMEDGWEACLSLPGLTGLVSRHRRIRYRGFGFRGEPIERTASGFHARVVQHECDHLDGVLYPRRMRNTDGFGFVDEIRRHPLDPTGDRRAAEQERS